MDGGASIQPKRKLAWNMDLDQLVSQVTKQIQVQIKWSFYGFLKHGPCFDRLVHNGLTYKQAQNLMDS